MWIRAAYTLAILSFSCHLCCYPRPSSVAPRGLRALQERPFLAFLPSGLGVSLTQEKLMWWEGQSQCGDTAYAAETHMHTYMPVDSVSPEWALTAMTSVKKTRGPVPTAGFAGQTEEMVRCVTLSSQTTGTGGETGQWRISGAMGPHLSLMLRRRRPSVDVSRGPNRGADKGLRVAAHPSPGCNRSTEYQLPNGGVEYLQEIF